MTDALGDVLLSRGIIDAEQLTRAQGLQRNRRLPLGQAVVALGYASEEQVWRVLAQHQGLPFVDLAADLERGGRLDPALIAAVPEEVVREQRVLPVARRAGKLVLALDDPVKSYALDTLQFVLDRDLASALATPTALSRAMAHYYGIEAPEGEADLADAVDAEGGEDEDAPIIRLVTRMITSAVEQGASDVHVEPEDGRVRVRFRRDGVLGEVASHEMHLLGPLLSRLKLMASMDIAEKRQPQDGRMNVQVRGRAIDIRASVLPSNHGETMVMRLLDKQRGLVSLPELGFAGADLERFRAAIERPNGIVLVTGPTGSGKTTTLYAALQELNRPDTKIITAEDPVEYEIPGINQVQVHGKIGLSFARILRAMLRQAPNVILVGEIRDAETAEVAIQAALTGHLVFSTLHTNDAPSAMTRLVDMGVKPFLASASVQAVLAQRLVRRLCPGCRVSEEPHESELRSLGLEASRVGGRPFWRPRGCGECDFTGYRGRVAVFELMVMDEALRDLVFRGASTFELRRQAERSGRMVPLVEDGIAKVLEGATSVAEVLRVSSEA